MSIRATASRAELMCWAICSWVMRMVSERTGSDTIRMTHEQIAQHISSAREAVARMLKNFSEDGLVELKRGAITLRDTGGLNHLK